MPIIKTQTDGAFDGTTKNHTHIVTHMFSRSTKITNTLHIHTRAVRGAGRHASMVSMKKWKKQRAFDWLFPPRDTVRHNTAVEHSIAAGQRYVRQRVEKMTASSQGHEREEDADHNVNVHSEVYLFLIKICHASMFFIVEAGVVT